MADTLKNKIRKTTFTITTNSSGFAYNAMSFSSGTIIVAIPTSTADFVQFYRGGSGWSFKATNTSGQAVSGSIPLDLIILADT